MDLLTILALAVALAMDALAVSLAVGLRLGRITSRHVFRIAFHFGLFQALMPIIGWSVGSSLAKYLQTVDHWIAFVLLAGIGGKMLWESRAEDGTADGADPTRGWSLVILSIATSIDALAVGFTLALLHVSVWFPAVVIGLVAAGLSWAGIGFGARIGRRWSRVADAAGGTILILIGLRILVSHLVG